MCTGAGQDRTGQGRTGQDRTGQGRTGQDRTGQDRAGQGRTGHGRAGQEKAGQGDSLTSSGFPVSGNLASNCPGRPGPSAASPNDSGPPPSQPTPATGHGLGDKKNRRFPELPVTPHNKRVGASMVRSLRTLPVLRVDVGSSNNTWTSRSATGLCSTPRGTTKNSPSSSSTTRSRR